jgi:hypothetical protein
VVLSWQGTGPGTRVVIERRVDPGAPRWEVLATVQDLRYVDADLHKKKTYLYRSRHEHGTVYTPEVVLPPLTRDTEE